jgi:glycosyltransferase involved in cell wall biosynthesis
MPGRVLVVAYAFPPIGGVGIQRTLKFVTYLPRTGWTPVVLTARDPGYYVRDPEANRQVPPDLAVERAFSPEPVKLRRPLARMARAVLRRGGSRGRRPSAGGSSAAPAGEPVGSPAAQNAGPDAGQSVGSPAAQNAGPDAGQSVGSPAAQNAGPDAGQSVGSPAAQSRPEPGHRRLQGIWSSTARWLFFPDEIAGWILFAWRRGKALNRARSFDVIYSSSPPISSHLAAGLIARSTGVPWVADFRDPWLGNSFAAPLPFWQRPLQRRLERWIARHADRLVFASPGTQEQYTPRYPWAADRMLTIPNGYDRNDLTSEVLAALRRAGDRAGSGPGGAPATFRLVYGGSLYGEHELEILLDGIELLLSRRPELRARLRVEFIGQVNLRNRGVAARYAAPERLGSIVSYAGFLPRGDALVLMAGADALLQILANEPGKEKIASGKLPEYVGLGKQVVAFLPEGTARDFLRELDWGIVEDPTPEGVARGVERVMEAPPPDRPADPEGRYDRLNLTARLAAVFDALSSGPAERGRRRSTSAGVPVPRAAGRVPPSSEDRP